VNQAETNPESVKIIQTVIGLADNLGLRVVAEGVESESQVSMLKQSRCKYAQGFYFARPVDAAGIEALLDGSRPLQPPPEN
jgi:EAL domain-containing protein (putative c-di-GMP-specific phosphodiesterase class I)